MFDHFFSPNITPQGLCQGFKALLKVPLPLNWGNSETKTCDNGDKVNCLPRICFARAFLNICENCNPFAKYGASH